jgi:hypothetical protein
MGPSRRRLPRAVACVALPGLGLLHAQVFPSQQGGRQREGGAAAGCRQAEVRGSGGMSCHCGRHLQRCCCAAGARDQAMQHITAWPALLVDAPRYHIHAHSSMGAHCAISQQQPAPQCAAVVAHSVQRAVCSGSSRSPAACCPAACCLAPRQVHHDPAAAARPRPVRAPRGQHP